MGWITWLIVSTLKQAQTTESLESLAMKITPQETEEIKHELESIITSNYFQDLQERSKHFQDQ
jgi:hypothetical protein